MPASESMPPIPKHRPKRYGLHYRRRLDPPAATQNVEGEFFVDHRCIDCDTCRGMAPETFKRVAVKAAVTKQPSSPDERIKALQALLSCPTGSIHTEKPPKDIKEVHKTFPIPIDEQNLLGIYHCGYHSERSYGAASFLIVHPDGNILVDRYFDLIK